MYAAHVIAGETLLLKKLANAIYADIKGDSSIARRISYRNGLAGCRRAAITAACQKNYSSARDVTTLHVACR